MHGRLTALRLSNQSLEVKFTGRRFVAVLLMKLEALKCTSISCASLSRYLSHTFPYPQIYDSFSSLSKSRFSKSSSTPRSPRAWWILSVLWITSLFSLLVPPRALSNILELRQMSGTTLSSRVRVYGGPRPSSPVLTHYVTGKLVIFSLSLNKEENGGGNLRMWDFEYRR
jgi:hypothetical protein